MTSYLLANFGRASLIRRTRGSMNTSPRYTGTTTDTFIREAILSPASQTNAMPICEYGEGARHLSRFLLHLPAECIAKHLSQFIHLFASETAEHCQHRPPQHKIVEMHDLFMLHKEDDLTARVIGHRPENKIGAPIHKRCDGLRARTITLE